MLRFSMASFTIETYDNVEAYLMELSFTVEGAKPDSALYINITLTDGTKFSYDVRIYYTKLLLYEASIPKSF